MGLKTIGSQLLSEQGKQLESERLNKRSGNSL